VPPPAPPAASLARRAKRGASSSLRPQPCTTCSVSACLQPGAGWRHGNCRVSTVASHAAATSPAASSALPVGSHSSWQQRSPRHACAAAARTDAPHAEQQTVSVCEYLLSFQLKAGCQPERAVAALEALWALQFMLPGCLCAFGGSVLQEPAFLHGTGAPMHMRLAELYAQHTIALQLCATIFIMQG
jgi:hypothetical protein